MVVKVTVKQRRVPVATGPAACGEEGCGLLLTRLARAANRSLACALDELGLRSQQFAVLHLLAEAGPLAQADLAANLRVHPSNLVRLLDELEQAGLVGRMRDSEDRRRQLVTLAERGEQTLFRANRIAADTEEELLAPLNPAERQQLRVLLGSLAAHACRSR